MIRNFTKIILKNNIRIYLSDYTDVVDKILSYHQYPPLPNLILANAITSFSVLKFLYDCDNLLIRIKSNGAIKSIIIDIKDNNVRALVSNPNIETEYDKSNFNSIPLILGIGDSGTIEVSREIKNEIFKSETPLVKFDIITDLVYYLNKSDQIYSAVINDVELFENDPTRVKKAKNILFQLLPSHTEEDKIWIEEFIKNNDFKNLTITEIEELMKGKKLDIKQLDSICWCNKEKFINAISLFSLEEKQDIFKDNEIEVVCEFCNSKYIIKKDECI